MVAGAIVLLGTLFPLLSEIFGDDRANLGPGFFNVSVGPFFLAAILLIGICAVTGWTRTTLTAWLQASALPLGAALVLVLVLALATSAPIWAVFAFALSGYALSAVLVEVLRGVIARSRDLTQNPIREFAGSLAANRRRYSAMVAHLGIILMAFGVTGSSALQTEIEASLALGETAAIGRYTVTYEDLQMRKDTASVDVVSAVVSITNSGKPAGLMIPEKYFHRSFQQPVTEVAIRSTWQEDLYVILAGWDVSSGKAAFQLIINPAVMWIWIGGGLLACGGIAALLGHRRPPAEQDQATAESDSPDCGEGPEPCRALRMPSASGSCRCTNLGCLIVLHCDQASSKGALRPKSHTGGGILVYTAIQPGRGKAGGGLQTRR
jgi:cytochrome c-type biogenesis protein CcmF